MTIIRWFLSSTVREAVHLKRHVRRLLRHQSDVLSNEAREALQSGLGDMDLAIQTLRKPAELRAAMTVFEGVANQWLRPYPNAGWRENVEMLLVALAVAMAIRTFWLQPFKIPTGSMQPTLYGVTSENLLRDDPRPIPGLTQRVREWFAGVSYVSLKAKTEGTFQGISRPMRLLIFNIKQTVLIGGRRHTLWFPPDGGGYDLAMRAGLSPGRPFHAGEEVMRLRVVSGDHLFVNRMKFNFRKPRRGDIVVFETKGIPALPPDQFYIKRLVGLPNEEIRIGNDRHLIINGDRLDASTHRFENIYSFDPNEPPRDSVYSGHVNTYVANLYRYPQPIAPLFPDETVALRIPPHHLMVMGDNTMNSQDSRTWGVFDEKHVIGNAAFVYWPISERFGWGFW